MLGEISAEHNPTIVFPVFPAQFLSSARAIARFVADEADGAAPRPVSVADGRSSTDAHPAAAA